MVAINDLRELFVDQLKDLYNAENQLVKALPKMAKAAHDPELQQTFDQHFHQTQRHVNRLEQIFNKLGQKASGRTCYGMKGCLEEGKEAMSQHAPPEVADANLIAAAQRVEHYEMAGYGTVRTFARMLGDHDAEHLLQETLNEEGAADKKLTQLAENKINVEAERPQV